MTALDALVDPIPAPPALSTTRTSRPRRDNSRAVEDPTIPAPMMMASAVMAMVLSILDQTFATAGVSGASAAGVRHPRPSRHRRHAPRSRSRRDSHAPQRGRPDPKALRASTDEASLRRVG